MTEEITGTVGTIIFESADGYTVAEIEADGPTVVVGNMPGLQVGEVTRFFGSYKNHPRYGRQFRVSSFETKLPTDVHDMALFLSSGFIKGVGEVLGQRIVEEFGNQTFEVIETEPDRLSDIRGISIRMANEIHAAFVEYSREKYVYAELMGLGLTAHQATAAAAELGSSAASMIKENPYVLIDRVRGFDFIRADQIAVQLGIEFDAPFRIQHGIMNVLNKLLQNGDMYVSRERLIPHVAERLDVEEEDVSFCLMQMVQEGDVVLKRYGKEYVVVFSRRAHDAEMKVASKLTAMAADTGAKEISGLTELMDKQQKAFSLSDEQTQAVRLAVTRRVCVITGGPGTGKTTILKAVLQVLGADNRSAALAAPTGRAAKRMQEATGADAQTIHRLLEYAYDEDAFQPYFKRNDENPLDADVVIVDEVSMLDIFLFKNLLDAIPENGRLVLVGDADQLPSVGPGNVMRDILHSQVIPVVRLTYHFRNEGRIADAAYEILEGKMPHLDDKEFQLVECDSVQQTIDKVLKKYMEFTSQNMDVQVIAPIKRTEVGTLSLNERIRDVVNPINGTKTEMKSGDRLFREGDRVMQITNNYQREWKDHLHLTEGKGIFNGEIGQIVGIHGGITRVEFEDGKTSEYELNELRELDGAFAYTIHKAQGSEFDVVIVPMYYNPNPFFTRNLLYTGITRARRKVILIGRRHTVMYMIENAATGRRKTALSNELKYLSTLTDQQKINVHGAN